jgi:3-deoxy-D-manno-octulosonic-acid transferase
MAVIVEDTLWIRCTSDEMYDVAVSLFARLLADGDPLTIVVTGGSAAVAQPKGDRAVATFLTEHAVTGVLCLGDTLDLEALVQCSKKSIPTGVVGQTFDNILTAIKPRMFQKQRKPIEDVLFWMTDDTDVRNALINSNVSASRISTLGHLSPDTQVLTHNEDERHRLATGMKTRPSWLAAGARLDDVGDLAQAHKAASRVAHRLLLFVAPKDDPEPIARAFRAFGLNVSEQAEGLDPEESTQVYVTDGMEEMGLFYRLAPITFVAGTFGQGAVVDPFDPASLGSPVIAGPRQRPFGDKFMRLLSAGAMLQLASIDRLGDGVAQLLSVDRAAQMANAGWQVSTEGVEVLTKVENMVRGRLLRESM